MSETSPSFDRLIQGLRSGDSRTESWFWERYGPLLEELAGRHLGGNMQRRFGPDDVAQSACRTFMRRAQLGQYEVPDAASLWRLLSAIALSKVREQARFHRRQRRNVYQETGTDDAVDNESGDRSDLLFVDRQPTPDDAVAFADQFQQLIGSIAPEEREIVELKLQDRSNSEIARQMRYSERSIRRILARIRSRFEDAFSHP